MGLVEGTYVMAATGVLTGKSDGDVTNDDDDEELELEDEDDGEEEEEEGESEGEEEEKEVGLMDGIVVAVGASVMIGDDVGV